jgi:hypothetical protein
MDTLKRAHVVPRTRETHLWRIASPRPLEQINDVDQRAAAEEVSARFRAEFLGALSD